MNASDEVQSIVLEADVVTRKRSRYQMQNRIEIVGKTQLGIGEGTKYFRPEWGTQNILANYA